MVHSRLSTTDAAMGPQFPVCDRMRHSGMCGSDGECVSDEKSAPKRFRERELYPAANTDLARLP